MPYIQIWLTPEEHQLLSQYKKEQNLPTLKQAIKERIRELIPTEQRPIIIK